MNDEIEITCYDAEMAGAWDAFVGASRNGTFLFKRGFMDYHSDRFADCSMMARDSRGQLLAVLPANRVEDTLYSHQGLTYGGWIMADRCTGPVMLDVMEASLKWMRCQGVKELVYKPVPHIYHRYPAEEDVYALFRAGASVSEVNLSSAIDLGAPMRFNENSRRALRRASATDVAVAETDDYAAFWSILEEVLSSRHNASPVHSLEEIRLLHSRFPGHIRLHGAYSTDGRMIAGTVIFDTGVVAHAQYIASSAEGRGCGALALLFHRLITVEYAHRRYFDFGISNESHGLYLNAGLISQKSGFGGRGTAYTTYALPL